MMRVQRRNGTEEEFISEKIVVAIVKAGGRANIARSIAAEVETALKGDVVITTEQIRNEVLNRLKEKDAKTYESWLQYDRQNKREE